MKREFDLEAADRVGDLHSQSSFHSRKGLKEDFSTKNDERYRHNEREESNYNLRRRQDEDMRMPLYDREYPRRSRSRSRDREESIMKRRRSGSRRYREIDDDRQFGNRDSGYKRSRPDQPDPEYDRSRYAPGRSSSRRSYSREGERYLEPFKKASSSRIYTSTSFREASISKHTGLTLANRSHSGSTSKNPVLYKKKEDESCVIVQDKGKYHHHRPSY